MKTVHHEGAKTSKITEKIGHRDTETQRRNNNAGREERAEGRPVSHAGRQSRPTTPLTKNDGNTTLGARTSCVSAVLRERVRRNAAVCDTASLRTSATLWLSSWFSSCPSYPSCLRDDPSSVPS
jgi:hypothetical protein